MYVIRVAPLAALPTTVPAVLDYFWSESLPMGSVVKVLVGRRPMKALVLESLDLAHAKIGVKKSSFGLKKISAVVKSTPQITPEQFTLAQWVSRQYHAPLGMCLNLCI
jgi:primosomal protein N'